MIFEALDEIFIFHNFLSDMGKEWEFHSHSHSHSHSFFYGMGMGMHSFFRGGMKNGNAFLFLEEWEWKSAKIPIHF